MTSFKIVATVRKVSDPVSLTPGKPPHVVMPCTLFEEGDRIVFQDNEINMDETTGSLCIFLITSLLPVINAMQRSVEPVIDQSTGKPFNDSMQKVKWFSCPDAERPVVFELEKIPIPRQPKWVIAEQIALGNPGQRVHLHLPNPNDRKRGVTNNLGEEKL